MTNGLKMTLAAALCAANATAAMAGEVRRMKTPDGLYVTYRPSTERYCLRASNDTQATKLGLTLHATECATKDGWARQGLTLIHRTAASQVASVD